MIDTSVINISCLIFNQNFLFILVSSVEINEEGYRGLQCSHLHKRHLLQKKLSTVTSTYALVDSSSSFTLSLDEGNEEGEEESEEDDSSSDEE